MKTKILLLLLVGTVLVSCSDDDNQTSQPTQLNLNLTGLENLGANYRYEGWIIVNNAPVTTGTFTVNDAGTLSQTSFTVDSNALVNATQFVLSIEPTVDPDPAPSNTKYLVGDFSGNSATISAGIVGDFTTATGKYLIASPTDGGMNPYAGVWFMNGVTGMAGLSLPTLDSGWKYEGWVVSGTTVLSTGRFTNPAMADESAFYSGSMAGPTVPGEDFITNAPAGLTFPGNLRGATLVISIEPNPDNSPMPFTLKPLSHIVSQNVVPGDTNDMTRSLTSFPTGTVTRN